MQKNVLRIKQKLILEGLIGLLIALSALLFYAYKYVPSSENIEEWNFMGITFTKNGYFSIFDAFYFYCAKIVPLYLFVVWFITCKHWWYHAILIPISMYAFQLYAIFNAGSDKVDENELLYLLVVSTFIIPLVYFIRVKLVDKYVHGIDLEAMEAELNTLKQKQSTRDSENPKKSDFIEKDKNEGSIKPESFSDKLDRKFSTKNIKDQFNEFQNTIKGWLF